MRLIVILLLSIIGTPVLRAQQNNPSLKCGLPRVKAEDDSSGPHDRIKDINQKLLCYSDMIAALEAERLRLAAENSRLTVEAKNSASPQQPTGEPLHTSVTGHLFKHVRFSQSACVQKAKDYANQTGGSTITFDESSVTYAYHTNVVIIECNGWPSNVTVSGHNASTMDLAKQIDLTVFPKE